MRWDTFERFISDKDIYLSGYQAHATDPGKGLFLFAHDVRDCFSTLVIKVETFQEIIDRTQKLEPFLVSQENCPGYCENVTELRPCHNVNCKGNAIRQMMVDIINLKKAS